MAAKRYHLPQKKRSSTKSPSASDWKLNLILILLVIQTGFLGWIWWSGNLPTSPSEPQKQVQQPAQETVIRQETDAPTQEEITQPQTTQNQQETTRSFTDDPIRIQLLNGCGVRGIARRVADCMRNKGFDVRETGNANRFNYAKTQVISRVDESALARMTADALGVTEISVDPDPSLVDVEVTIILGNDHGTLNCR